ncbi:MAG TPA: hypothetical protein VF559_03075 [Caulobacteraceae bacterium]|jgi:hypothetical protein
MVTELAALGPDDVEDILSRLELQQQRRLRVLLAEFRGERTEAPQKPAAGEDDAEQISVSPWILERANGVGVTPTTAQTVSRALRELSRQPLPPGPAEAQFPAGPADLRRLLKRLGAS